MPTATVIYPEFDRPLSEDPERSWTLPARYYFDPAIYEAEREKIFFKSWQYIGHRSQLENPGDYITGAVVDQPVFVLRDRSGELKGYYNVCLHRGGPLGQGVIMDNKVVCPWHGWEWDPKTGQAGHSPAFRVTVYPIKVEGEDVLIEI